MDSVDQFVQSCTDSGLLAGEELRQLLAHAPASAQQDSQHLAQHLVNLAKLTPYQADMLCQDRGKGLVLGNYLLLDKLGQGGMGVVYRARHRRMDRVVALKVLQPALTLDPSAVERFRREVKAAARLSHANIVTAYDADEADGAYFLVMEYVAGQNLAQFVRNRGPLPVEQALCHVLQAARGLEHAHAAGIVHRDVKPSNLLLDPNGTVKVLDLGLSGSAGESAAAGVLVGTPEYLAPEQTEAGSHADARADIYSLGCTLYFLLTGHPPYGGGTPLEKALCHRDLPIPSLWMAQPDVPAGLEAVFRRMVAKQPADRYQSMTEVIAGLEACRPGPLTVGFPWRRRKIAALAVSTGVLAVLVTVALLSGSPSSDSRAEPSSTRLTSETITTRVAAPKTSSVDAQLAVVIAELKKRNPDFDGKVTHTVDAAGGIELLLSADALTDLSPLRDLPKLRALYCSGTYPGPAPLKDLSPLAGLDLTHLVVRYTSVTDLTPLAETRLTWLDCALTPVSDLSPLADLPLVSLCCNATKIKDLRPLQRLRLSMFHCDQTRVADLSPLEGMPLAALYCSGSAVSDLSPLKNMKLASLNIQNTPVTDLAPLKGMPLTMLDCSRTRVKDLAPLQGMPLQTLMCDFDADRDGPLLRSLTTLRVINYEEAARFWSKYPSK